MDHKKPLTDNEINEVVAKKLGWVQCCNPKTMENGKIVDCFGWSKGGSHFHEVYPDYCHSIEAAWEIVETRKEVSIVNQDGFSNKYGFYLHNNGENWEAGWLQFSDGEWMSGEKVKADTAPMAICKAFLKLP